MEALKYTPTENDGTFWMNFTDFIKNFRSANVCKTQEYQQVRLKGSFTTRLCVDSEDNHIRSEYFYELDITKKQKLMLGIHQEDERVQNVMRRKPYMSMGMSVLKKVDEGEGYELSYVKEFSNERQAELEIELDVGHYIILPRASGCTLRRPLNAPSEYIKLLDSNGDLHPIVELTINNIFDRLDSVEVGRSIDYAEFKEFYERLGIEFTEEDFRKKILANFCSSPDKQINERGFVDFFKEQIRQQGDTTIWRWFEQWGYDKDLYPIEARTYVITAHSLDPININICETNVQNDLDDITNRLVLQNFGEVLEQKPNVYRLLCKYHPISYTFSFGMENLSDGPLELRLDCNQSRNMLYSEPDGKMVKIVEPGKLEFFMHSEAAPGAEEFARGVTCSYKQTR